MRNLREVSEREIYLFIPLQENPAKLIAFPSNWEKGKNKIPFVNSSVSLSLVPLPKEKFKNTHLFRLGKPTVVVAGIKEGRRNGTRRCDKVFGQISWKKVKHLFFSRGGRFRIPGSLGQTLALLKKDEKPTPVIPNPTASNLDLATDIFLLYFSPKEKNTTTPRYTPPKHPRLQIPPLKFPSTILDHDM